MKTHFEKTETKYTGTQLVSHYAYQTHGLLGDSTVAFIGPCEVKLEQMVDLEDVQKQAPIYSPKMLHFIIEFFSWDLKTTIAFQRLLMAQFREQLQKQGISELERQGDDLFLKDKKLSVSIATASPISTMIHIGLNIETQGTPVPTVGLIELQVDPTQLAKDLLSQIEKEYLEIMNARCKVRSVK